MQLSEIQVRDPFVLPVPDEGCYYLFGSTDKNIWGGPGTGFDCYRSTDLQEWSEPIPAFRPPADFWSPGQYWAPEVFRYNNGWYMLATFTAPDDAARGTQVLVADHPSGPYLPWSDGPVTPPDWRCLDGTLHVEDGRPWMVFCHEWLQVEDGEVAAVPLSRDLRSADGDPVLLFKASEAPWVRPYGYTSPGGGEPRPYYVTDGPYLHSAEDGSLLMLWSSFGDGGYTLAVARSSTGKLLGPWQHDDSPLWADDGGHGMLVRSFEGRLHLAVHSPNDTPNERALLVPLVESGGMLRSG